jgi:hypothetical protein
MRQDVGVQARGLANHARDIAEAAACVVASTSDSFASLCVPTGTATAIAATGTQHSTVANLHTPRRLALRSLPSELSSARSRGATGRRRRSISGTEFDSVAHQLQEVHNLRCAAFMSAGSHFPSPRNPHEWVSPPLPTDDEQP